jgi:hypothetical protein
MDAQCAMGCLIEDPKPWKIPWKNIIKGAAQGSGHSLKLHFCMFEKSQRKHNSLDYHFFLEIFSINYKIYMFKA